MPARSWKLFLSNFHGVSGAPSTPANRMPPFTGWPTWADTGFVSAVSKA